MESKTILITGATRGIGRGILEKFAKNSWDVIGIYQKSHEKARELEETYPNVRCFSVDISNYDEVSKFYEKINCPKIDVLVNNAGISTYGLFTDENEQSFNKIFDINVKGAFNVTNAVLPRMISHKDGVIINISSMWGEVGASYEVLYSMTKGALISMTKALAKELGPSNIRVNCITPGVIDTDMLDDLSEQDISSLKYQTPLERLGTKEDIANSVYFLSSNDASFITGQILGVNGGFVI